MKRNHDDIRVDIVQRATRETAPWSPASTKRFISDVYAQVVADGRDGGVPIEEFKAVLLELQRRGDVELARADLIAAMPFDKVQASEIDARGATYHFIVGPRKNPIDLDDFEREIEERERKRENELDQVQVALRASCAIRGKRTDRMAIVSGETADRDDGGLRVTFFADDGPLGHATRKTEREIAWEVRDMIQPPYVPMTETEVIAWTSTPEYELGSRRVAFVQAVNALSWYASKAGRRDIYERASKAAHEQIDAGGDRSPAAWEKGLAILQAAIRELPTPNPSRRLVRNPAWVTSALANHYTLLDDQVPARWMPLLAGVTNDRKKLVADLVEFGCGAYGCVIATNDPKTVLKVTTDDTEAEFAADLEPTLVAPICVHYELVVRLAAKHQGRPVHLLWRESADQVGQLRTVSDRARQLVIRQHEIAKDVYAMLFAGDSPAQIRKLLPKWVQAVDDMAKDPALRFLSRGMLTVWEEQRIFFGDIHDGNLGVVKRDGEPAWVITDPGHVAVLEDPDLWG